MDREFFFSALICLLQIENPRARHISEIYSFFMDPFHCVFCTLNACTEKRPGKKLCYLSVVVSLRSRSTMQLAQNSTERTT